MRSPVKLYCHGKRISLPGMEEAKAGSGAFCDSPNRLVG
jgi:hypothetical protein